MTELVRSVVSRVRVYFKDRRQSPRLRVRLVFSVGIKREVNGNGSNRRAKTLQGHTRDVSVKGMALLVPQAHLDGHHLAAEGELTVELQIGSGDPISMIVMPRRYERLEETELGCAYLIGVRIMKISEPDQARYLSFVHEGLESSKRTSTIRRPAASESPASAA
ncbi:MAG TPA: PilZ domain-containing protein [Pyrinomonadaceae bacterium]|nr:PilZ domain-containing protein [Pyrinomonadaceae bacterium]